MEDPLEILRAVAAQIPALTGGARQGEVLTLRLPGGQLSHDLNAIVEQAGPGHGLLTVDHTVTDPDPGYVTASFQKIATIHLTAESAPDTFNL